VHLATVVGLVLEQRDQNVSGARFLQPVTGDSSMANRGFEVCFAQAVHHGDKLFVLPNARIFEPFEAFEKDRIQRSDPRLTMSYPRRPEPVHQQQLIDCAAD